MAMTDDRTPPAAPDATDLAAGGGAFATLILVRHGQSQWNLENRFTGWWDVPVTQKGAAEAVAAGERLMAAGLAPDMAFTSVQTRAIQTLHLMLEAMGRLWIPEVKDWRLNERHYGGLTGLDKAETAARHGADQVQVWRRSFDVPPPPMDADSAWDLSGDPRYAGLEIPVAESLKDTIARVLPYHEAAIMPELRRGRTVLVAAHGNSLRALVKHLSGISDADIAGLEIATGEPIVYRFDAKLAVIDRAILAGD